MWLFFLAVLSGGIIFGMVLGVILCGGIEEQGRTEEIKTMAKMIDGEKLIKKFEHMKKVATEVEASENFDQLKVLISRSSVGAWDWAIKAIREEIGQAFSPD